MNSLFALGTLGCLLTFLFHEDLDVKGYSVWGFFICLYLTFGA